MGDKFHSHMTAAPAAATPQQLDIPTDGEASTFGRTASMTSIPNDLAEPQAVVEANDKQEWEICDIIGKEDIDGIVYYWVDWSATLVPKYELKKAKALVDKFEARLRAQGQQRRRRRRGRLS
jgi:hypothetical protein